MLLTVDTSLGDAILARYGGFVYSISDGAQMLLLQHDRRFIQYRNGAVFNYAVRLHIAEQADLFF